MASFMTTGGRVGEIIGLKRAFTIGCIVYAGVGHGRRRCLTLPAQVRTAISRCSTSRTIGTSRLHACSSSTYYVKCDFAYTSGAERALKKADTSGWTVVSMKDDFATVLAAPDGEDATAARPAVKAV